MTEKINIDEKFSLFSEHWRPKIVAELNGQELKLAKLHGEFPWHSHIDEDELFLVWKGNLTMQFREKSVDLKAGDSIVVPKGVEHSPLAKEECLVLLLEPAGLKNSGDADVDAIYDAPIGVRV